uniref:C2 domain-containing protein n=1 Tax=Trichuris muris TaxID=70415 RepID=A0A5S6QEC1_TRIMR
MESFLVQGWLHNTRSSFHVGHNSSKKSSSRSRSSLEIRGAVAPLPVRARSHTTPTGKPHRFIHAHVGKEHLTHNLHMEQDPINMLLFTMQRTHLNHDNPVYVSHMNSAASWSQETELARPNTLEPCAELLVTITLLERQQTLKVVLNSARNLLPKRSEMTVDPFAIVWLVHGRTLLDRRITRSKYKTRNPVFNETFVFSVEGEELENLQLVSNMNSPTGQDEIGHVLIGKSGSPLGQALWKSIISKPDQKITKWQPLTLKW